MTAPLGHGLEVIGAALVALLVLVGATAAAIWLRARARGRRGR